MQKLPTIVKLIGLTGLLALLSACTTTTMTEAERDVRMAQCQQIEDDDERAACLERLALGDPVDPLPQSDPLN